MRLTPTRRSLDVVPLQQRLAYTQLLRVVLAFAVVAYRVALPDVVGGSLYRLAVGAALLVAAAAAAELLWRHAERSKSLFFGGLLLLDGLFLAAALQETGGADSPIRYLVVVHVVTTTLVGSYRTGLKMALWHSLLLFTAYNAALTRATPFWPVPARLDHAEILAFAAALAVLALGTAAFSAVNERELRRRRFDLAALTAMCNELAQGGKPAAVAEVLLRTVRATFDLGGGAVVSGSGSELDVLASTVEGPSPVVGVEDRSVISEAWRLRAPQLRRSLGGPADAGLAALLPTAGNVIVVPLVADGIPVGALVVEQAQAKGATIERQVVATIEQFAAHGALALRNACLLEEIRTFADTDGLTQVANRRSFDERLAEEVARAERQEQPMALVMVDVDHFKALNDTHGHQTGDEVLREVAATLAGGVRDFDLVARYGGEEFALVLPGASAAEARAIGDRLRVVLASAATTVPVTVSMGVAAYPSHAATPRELVEAADQALYRAKKSGRNRVLTSRRRAARPALAVVA